MTQAGHGWLTRDWGDGQYSFRLVFGGWKEIHEKCGVGPAEMLDRLVNRKWLANDLYEIVRLALIGGGMSAVDAMKKATDYVKERPLMESVPIAIEIVSVSLMGPVGEVVAAKKKAKEQVNSHSQSSTATAQ